METVILRLNRCVSKRRRRYVKTNRCSGRSSLCVSDLVVFDNGEKKYFDVEPYIKGEWYGQLRSFEYFKRVTTDGFTVIWPDGQDICPDELYDFGKLVS